TYANFDGVGIHFSAFSHYGTVYQFGTLTDVQAGRNYYADVNIEAHTIGGYVRQNVRMFNVGAYDGFGYGVVIAAAAINGGRVVQSVYADGLDASGNYSDNIVVYGGAKYGGTALQSVELRNSNASYSTYGFGLHELALAYSYGTVVQNVYAKND